MNHPGKTIWKFIGRKLAVILLLAVSAAAFATLGDGKIKSDNPKSSLHSNRITKSGSFSLKSGYTYRGYQVINTQNERKYINLNTAVTFQKGNTSFIIPLKKKVILDNVKIDIANKQSQKNW